MANTLGRVTFEDIGAVARAMEQGGEAWATLYLVCEGTHKDYWNQRTLANAVDFWANTQRHYLVCLCFP